MWRSVCLICLIIWVTDFCAGHSASHPRQTFRISQNDSSAFPIFGCLACHYQFKSFGLDKKMQTAHGKKRKNKTIYIFAEWKDGNVLNRIRILKDKLNGRRLETQCLWQLFTRQTSNELHPSLIRMRVNMIKYFLFWAYVPLTCQSFYVRIT